MTKRPKKQKAKPQPTEGKTDGEGQLEETGETAVADAAAAQAGDHSAAQAEPPAPKAAGEADPAGDAAPAGVTHAPLADDQALMAAARISDIASDCIAGRLYDEPMDTAVAAMAAFLRKNPDAPAEAIVIELRRKGYEVPSWSELKTSQVAAREFFKLSLVLLDAKIAGMQPVDPPQPLPAYGEAAEIMADQPGELTDQAVR